MYVTSFVTGTRFRTYTSRLGASKWVVGVLYVGRLDTSLLGKERLKRLKNNK